MDLFSYYHICDHRILKNQRSGQVEEITVNSGKGQVHKIINGATVINILEIRVIEFDPNDRAVKDFYYDTEDDQTYVDPDNGEGYYDEMEDFVVEYAPFFEPGKTISNPIPSGWYEPYLHNRVRWLVKPPIKYVVKATLKYTSQEYDTYTLNTCPICDGKGWFVDLFNRNGKFEKVSGVIKVGQRVLKDLITEVNTHPFDSTYGTELKKDVIGNMFLEEELEDYVRTVVSSVEDQYLTNQQEILNTLDDSEILTSLSVEKVYQSPTKKMRIMIDLVLETEETNQLLRVGF